MKDCMDKYSEAMILESKNRVEPIKEVCEYSDKGYYYLPKCEETDGWRYYKEVHSKIKSGDTCRLCGKPIKIKGE